MRNLKKCAVARSGPTLSGGVQKDGWMDGVGQAFSILSMSTGNQPSCQACATRPWAAANCFSTWTACPEFQTQNRERSKAKRTYRTRAWVEKSLNDGYASVLMHNT